MPPGLLLMSFGSQVDDQDLLAVAAGPGEDPAEGVGDERAAPELDAAVGRPLVADPVDGRDVDAVADGVGPLHGLPGVGLGLAVLGLLGGVPADRGGVEQDLGPLQRGQAGGLGIPLVPADERADARRTWSSNAWKPRSPGVK